jgi:hypothetical protein
MLPGATIANRRERDWHSATFVGSRLWLQLVVPPNADPEQLRRFQMGLTEYDFAMRKGFVADICIADETRSIDGTIIFDIEALVLEE